MKKFLYPIKKLNIKSWIKYWILKSSNFIQYVVSEIISGTNFILTDSTNELFKLFEIKGNSVQDGTPTSENEVPILSSGENGSASINIVNNNLLKITENTRLTRCTYVSGANTNEYKLLCTQSDMYFNEVRAAGQLYAEVNGNLMYCKYGETIYFDMGNPLFNKCYFVEYDRDLKSLGYREIGSSNGTYTPTNTNCAFVTFRGGYGINAVPDATYTLAPIISKTPIVTYVSHQEQTKTISTQQPMKSIGDVRDEFVKINDNWYERHNIGRKILNGTETWLGPYNPVNDTLRFYINFTTGELNVGLCNNFSLGNFNNRATDEVEHFYVSTNSIQIRIKQTIANTDEEFKNWLAQKYANGTPVYIDYLLAEPIDLPCTEAQIEVLESLKNLNTYKPVTNIYSEDVVPPNLEIQYVKGVINE